MDSLEFLHAVESFIGRDLSHKDGDTVIELAEEGGRDVQTVAELMMTQDDFNRVYGDYSWKGAQ